ncbi:MAG: 5-methyltetrahydropteroyltriglutamate--homocysteine S-methyltransferase [Actinomycetaceae bacterium]|nr:5-methyltetrahydropteroyltriglutamate--homocysteine S-methyltransferase [Actinomycetaceae bacterium]
MAHSQFPIATILGYPRIGPARELKRAVESYWAGKISQEELRKAEQDLRLASYARLTELGLTDEAAIPESFSLYDQVLDVTTLLGAIPERFSGRTGYDLYFSLARGDAEVAPLEMTKWFDTNYHYLVPEIGPDTTISLTDRSIIDRFAEAAEAGFHVRPTLVGPVTYLALAKSADGSSYSPLDRLDDVVAAYGQLLAELAKAGVAWVQFDEPALTSDNLPVERRDIVEAARGAWQTLAAIEVRPQILVTAPYGNADLAAQALLTTGVEAIHASAEQLAALAGRGLDCGGVTLVAGAVDGRNIWIADLKKAAATLDSLQDLGAAGLAVASTTSLLHVPYDVAAEKWDDAELDRNLHEWLAFADQKVGEIVTLARGLTDGWDAVTEPIERASDILARRAASAGVVRDEVRDRVADVDAAARRRVEYSQREPQQKQRLGLPLLPVTTIGSFPQTAQIRKTRAAFVRGQIDERQYHEEIRGEIGRVIALQEELDVDVLVHGEAERNDMVQYFAELLDGFAVTRSGWVQSYGTRCTRPSILWGDVARSRPLTVEWTGYAQSLTARPVKGMLTGPVTILAWSFVRDDLPIGDVADQVALALRDEIADLQARGVAIVQVDEPALREKLPLARGEHADYLAWAVGAFRLATSVAEPSTQIHTHLCYSEFGQIIDAIDDLDADVTSIEAARSRMEILPELAEHGYARGIGPGVWDIHSPRVPSVDELAELLEAATRSIPASRVWANPDCGLKTRAYPETEATLANLVAATKRIRENL